MYREGYYGLKDLLGSTLLPNVSPYIWIHYEAMAKIRKAARMKV